MKTTNTVVDALLLRGELTPKDISEMTGIKVSNVSEVLRRCSVNNAYGVKLVGQQPQPPGRPGRPINIYEINEEEYHEYKRRPTIARRMRQSAVVKTFVTHAGPTRTVWQPTSPYHRRGST